MSFTDFCKFYNEKIRQSDSDGSTDGETTEMSDQALWDEYNTDGNEYLSFDEFFAIFESYCTGCTLPSAQWIYNFYKQNKEEPNTMTFEDWQVFYENELEGKDYIPQDDEDDMPEPDIPDDDDMPEPDIPDGEEDCIHDGTSV